MSNAVVSDSAIAGATSSAHTTSKPARPSALSSAFRMRTSSSTTSTRAIGLCGIPGALLVELAELRAQPRDRAPQQLARARRRDAERLRDVLERELLDVVQAEQRDVALLEVVEGAPDAAEQLEPRGLLVGGARAVDQRHRALAVERFDVHVHQHRKIAAVVVDRHAHRFRELRLTGGLAGGLERVDLRGDAARDLADAARQQITAAQLVEDRAADALLGERQERLCAAAVVALRGLGQAEQSGGDQVVALDPGGTPARHLEGDPPRDLRMVGDELVPPRVDPLHIEEWSLRVRCQRGIPARSRKRLLSSQHSDGVGGYPDTPGSIAIPRRATQPTTARFAWRCRRDDGGDPRCGA